MFKKTDDLVWEGTPKPQLLISFSQGGYKGQGAQTDLVGPGQRGEEVAGEIFGNFPRFVGAALLPLDDAVGKDEAELTVHEAWLAIRESVEAELSRSQFLSNSESESGETEF